MAAVSIPGIPFLAVLHAYMYACAHVHSSGRARGTRMRNIGHRSLDCSRAGAHLYAAIQKKKTVPRYKSAINGTWRGMATGGMDQNQSP